MLVSYAVTEHAHTDAACTGTLRVSDLHTFESILRSRLENTDGNLQPNAPQQNEI